MNVDADSYRQSDTSTSLSTGFTVFQSSATVGNIKIKLPIEVLKIL